MKLKQRKPSLEPISEDPEDPDQEALHLRGTPTRCPFCHDGIALGREAWAVCKACLARHHVGCWREGGETCSACGQGEAFYETSRTSSGTQPALTKRPWVRPWFVVLMVVLGLVALNILHQHLLEFLFDLPPTPGPPF